MAIEPISFNLSTYNKLSIIRKQIEERTREFEEIEAIIRTTLLAIKEAEYLKSISSAYATLTTTEEVAQISSLESRRSTLFELLNTLNDLLSKLEHEAKLSGDAATSSPSASRIERNSLSHNATATPASEGRKALSFDEFKKKFPTSGI